MTPVFMTKILSLAAVAAFLTLAVLVAVPKHAGGQLGAQLHAASAR